MAPVKTLGIGDVQLAAVTEEGQASNQTGRALHSSTAFCDISRSIALAPASRPHYACDPTKSGGSASPIGKGGYSWRSGRLGFPPCLAGAARTLGGVALPLLVLSGHLANLGGDDCFSRKCGSGLGLGWRPASVSLREQRQGKPTIGCVAARG
jgi:hypothetical protein